MFLRVSNVLSWKSQKWVPEISGHLWKIWVGTLTNFRNPLYFFPNVWFLELQYGPEEHYMQDVKEMVKLVFNPRSNWNCLNNYFSVSVYIYFVNLLQLLLIFLLKWNKFAWGKATVLECLVCLWNRTCSHTLDRYKNDKVL